MILYDTIAAVFVGTFSRNPLEIRSMCYFRMILKGMHDVMLKNATAKCSEVDRVTVDTDYITMLTSMHA